MPIQTKTYRSIDKLTDTEVTELKNLLDYSQLSSVLLGYKNSVNFNSTANQVISINNASKYIIRKIISANSSIDLTTAVGGIYSSALTTKVATVTIATPDTDPAVVNCVSHGLSIGDPFYFTTTIALPTGVSANQIYFVLATNFGADSFKFSLVAAGTAIAASGTQSGVHTIHKGMLPIVANSQVYTALSLPNKFVDLTLATETSTGTQTGTSLIFSLETVQGVAATGDIYVFGDILV